MLGQSQGEWPYQFANSVLRPNQTSAPHTHCAQTDKCVQFTRTHRMNMDNFAGFMASRIMALLLSFACHSKYDIIYCLCSAMLYEPIRTIQMILHFMMWMMCWRGEREDGLIKCWLYPFYEFIDLTALTEMGTRRAKLAYPTYRLAVCAFVWVCLVCIGP